MGRALAEGVTANTNMSMVILFWCCALLMVYVYVGYPLLARVLGRWVDRQVKRADIRPAITIVVTAYNEEKSIRAKLENLLAVDYPRELMQILVASDASADATDAIVKEFAPRGVELLRVEGRQGKTGCQNAAVGVARGEIVFFTDATTELLPDAVALMVANFADPTVGCVAGRLVYVDVDASTLTGAGGTAYWDYELALRVAETQLGSLVGVSGCLYALRKAAYRDISPDLISDFVIALKMRAQGLRTVLEPKALCKEETLSKSRQELNMRVRVVIRSVTALVRERRMLNPFRYGAFAWQLWSHKALRYASPFIWLLLLAANATLLDQPIYLAAFVAQVAVIAAGVAGLLLHSRAASIGVLGKPYYFLLTNVASFIALLRYLKGDRVTVWKPIR